jgi:hypothetical protein
MERTWRKRRREWSVLKGAPCDITGRETDRARR